MMHRNIPIKYKTEEYLEDEGYHGLTDESWSEAHSRPAVTVGCILHVIMGIVNITAISYHTIKLC